MKIEEIKPGAWYYISHYGFSTMIKGKAVEAHGDLVAMKFYWGGPFRTKQWVSLSRILKETTRPTWFSNY